MSRPIGSTGGVPAPDWGQQAPVERGRSAREVTAKEVARPSGEFNSESSVAERSPREAPPTSKHVERAFDSAALKQFTSGGGQAKAKAAVTHNHLSLPHDPAFKRLHADTQKEVLDRMKTFAKPDNPAARVNIASLATDPNFAKLSPSQQKQMLQALDAAPADKTLLKDLKTLAANPNFQKLDAGTAADLLSRMQTPNAKARGNMLELLASPGFGRLNQSQQKQMLEALAKNPNDTILMVRLADLGNHANFQSLSDSVKNNVLTQIAKHTTDDAPREIIANLAKSDGFQKLTDDEKNQLTRYIGGANKELSGPVRTGVDQLMKSAAFTGGTADTRAAKLKDFLTTQPATPKTAEAPEKTFDSKRSAYDVGEPKSVPEGAKYMVEIEGKKYPVIMEPAKPGVKQNSIDDIAKALAAIPKADRQYLTKIVIKGDYPAPGKTSGYLETAGSRGVMTVWPNAPTKNGQGYLDSAMIHESGHAVTGTKWGDNTSGAKWNDWKEAIKKDTFIPSQYAKTGAPLADDFSETLLLYHRVKGTPAEAEMRELMPNRFKMIDDMEAGKK